MQTEGMERLERRTEDLDRIEQVVPALATKDDLKATEERMRTHFDVAAEDLRHHIQLVAEAVATLAERARQLPATGMRGLKPVVVDQSALDWEGWDDPALAARSPVRWKLLVSGDRAPAAGLVTGVGEVVPGGVLLRHHHEPEETYYVVSGRGHVEIDGVRRDVGPGTAVFIPPNARHTLYCTGAEPLIFVFTFARDRFADVEYHFDE